MTKEKVTLTLDAAHLAELRALIGRGSLSAAIDEAVAVRLAHLRHLAAVEEWLAELESSDGPIPPEARTWAAEEFEAWRQSARSTRRAG
ncbi:MAG: CopG family transcriptional regulator [Sporichthyaceae bacterium]